MFPCYDEFNFLLEQSIKNRKVYLTGQYSFFWILKKVLSKEKTQGLPRRLALRFKINLVVGWHYQYRVGNTYLFEQEGRHVNHVQ